MLRHLRLLSLSLACAGSVLSGQAQAPDRSVLPLPETVFPELKPILQAAVSQSPRMISRNLDLVMAEQNRIATRAGQLPTVGAYVQYNPWQRDDRADLPEPTNTHKLYYNISLNQPLFHWGALRNNTRIGQLQLKISQGNFAEAYRLLAQEIRSMYLQLVLKKLLVARTQLNVDYTQNQLAVAQTKFEKKVISEGEMFMPRLNHDQAMLAADRATEDFEATKRAFAKLTGSSPLADNQIATAIPAIVPAQDALGAILSAHVSKQDFDSYNIENLHRQIEVEKLNHQIATTRLKPKFNGILGASQDEQSYTSNIAQKYKLQSTFIGFQMNWAIFDGFAAKSAIASSLARRKQLEQAYDDAIASLSELARAQYKQLEFSSRGMEIANRLLVSSEGNLRSKEEDLRRGLSSEADVSAARLNYFDNQINAFNSRFDYLMKTADFLSMLLEDPALANLSKPTS